MHSFKMHYLFIYFYVIHSRRTLGIINNMEGCIVIMLPSSRNALCAKFVHLFLPSVTEAQLG